MVEAKLSKLMETQKNAQGDDKNFSHDESLADQSGLRESVLSYGRRRGLPIQERSQLWL